MQTDTTEPLHEKIKSLEAKIAELDRENEDQSKLIEYLRNELAERCEEGSDPA